MRHRIALAFIVVSAALVSFSAFAAVISIIRFGLDANTAAWVQAGGSIAAVVAAVWLFRSEAILKRRERRIKGEEIAWALRYALMQAQVEARIISTELVDEHILEQENPRRHWLIRTENCRNVLKIFAERTDHIHPALNFLASNGLLLLRQMEEDMKRRWSPCAIRTVRLLKRRKI
jgi:hypothetical protein